MWFHHALNPLHPQFLQELMNSGKNPGLNVLLLLLQHISDRLQAMYIHSRHTTQVLTGQMELLWLKHRPRPRPRLPTMGYFLVLHFLLAILFHQTLKDLHRIPPHTHQVILKHSEPVYILLILHVLHQMQSDL